MKRLIPHNVGLAFGAFAGLGHAFWTILVATGVAQTVLDFIFSLHMITPVYRIAEFHLATAVELILFTSVVGYAGGFFLAFLWNYYLPRDAGA